MTNNLSALRTTQMRYCCWNFVSTPKPKSDGYPTLKTVLGSKIVLGRKNRRNIMKQVARNPPTAVHIIVRRILLTGSGGALSTVLPLAPAEVPTAGLAAALGLSADADALGAGGVAFSAVVVVCFSSPSTFWFAS